jgi:hypothetical protein
MFLNTTYFEHIRQLKRSQSACSFRWFIVAENTVRWFIVREKHCWMAADLAE